MAREHTIDESWWIGGIVVRAACGVICRARLEPLAMEPLTDRYTTEDIVRHKVFDMYSANSNVINGVSPLCMDLYVFGH